MESSSPPAEQPQKSDNKLASSSELLASSSYVNSGVKSTSNEEGLSSIETQQLIAIREEEKAAAESKYSSPSKNQPFVPPLNLEPITSAAPSPSFR